VAGFLAGFLDTPERERDMKTNIFGKCDIFATPKDINDLQAYVDKFSGQEKIIAMTVMGMAWNLAHKMLADALAPDTSIVDQLLNEFDPVK
jgi:hypothetical protein